MGRSFRGQQKEQFRKSHQNTNKNTDKKRDKRSSAEQEVSELLTGKQAEQVDVQRTTPPPHAAVTTSAPIYKDLAGSGHLTQHAKQLMQQLPTKLCGAQPTSPDGPDKGAAVPPQVSSTVPMNTQPAMLRDNRYRQAPDPELSVLSPEMLNIDPANPLRGEVKFFDIRPEKLFGFVIVDPPGIKPTDLYRLSAKELINLRRREVFFHFNDGGLPIWKANQQEYPTIIEQRNNADFDIQFPQKGDRLVFFPIMVKSTAGTDKRSKAVPWVYEKDWDSTKLELLNANHYRFVRQTRGFNQPRPVTRLVWGGREFNWTVDDQERIASCFDKNDAAIHVKHVWQRWNPTLGALNYNKDDAWELCERPY